MFYLCRKKSFYDIREGSVSLKKNESFTLF